MCTGNVLRGVLGDIHRGEGGVLGGLYWDILWGCTRGIIFCNSYIFYFEHPV